MADTPKQETEQAPSAKKSGMMALIKAVVIISVIVVIEVAAASMLIPNAEETTEIAEQLATSEVANLDEEGSEATEEVEEQTSMALGDMIEVELGTYHVLSYDPETGSRTNVDFELFGTVLANEEGEFYPLYEGNKRRIREQILITVRSADVTDLTDAGLGLIKRKILEKTNRALGRPLLHEAIFSKFSFEER